MAGGRIRSLKPEWLEDQLLLNCSERARLLSVALILLADDYGNGRGHPAFIRGQTQVGESTADVDTALAELTAARFIVRYEDSGQSYYSIRNWSKHQKVDKPGKPRVPGPPSSSAPVRQSSGQAKVAYFIRGSLTGLIKIGESVDPVSRLADLAMCGSEPLELLAIGGVEREHHAEFAADRVHGEWFRPTAVVMARIREYSRGSAEPIAIAGYRDGKRTVDNVRVNHANVRGDHATDLDRDQERDLDREGRGSRGEPPATPALALSAPEHAKPDPIADLWAEQERLRAEAIPGSRRLALTADRRKKIAALLKSGHSLDDLRACLAAYAAEARTNGGEWFNGESNWVAANVARTLGRIGTTRANGHAAPTSSIDATAQALRDRGFLS